MSIYTYIRNYIIIITIFILSCSEKRNLSYSNIREKSWKHISGYSVGDVLSKNVKSWEVKDSTIIVYEKDTVRILSLNERKILIESKDGEQGEYINF